MGGGGWAFAWGPQDDAESVAAIRAGIDAGMNWIDTAAVYGLGHSEEIVAAALEGVAQRPYVFTKCERRWGIDRKIYKSLKADSIREECEASLRRLKVDVIDLYQIHWPEPDEDIEEGWGAMMRLKEEGKIRWAGVSNFSVAQMKRALPIGAITSLQPPYSLLVRDIEAETMPFCAEHKIGILCYSPMHSGLLSGGMTEERIAAMAPDDHRRNRPQFREPLLSRNLALVDLLRAIGARHGKAPGEVAIAWALHRPEVTAAIVGLRSPAQLTGVIGAGDLRLSTAEVDELEGFLAKQQ
jgi:aryl-alcohol dehydrogenase-like predicted oxidoreductase